MRVAYSKTFLKQAKNLTPSQKDRVKERIGKFAVNPLDPVLRNHALKGAYKDYRSIDITGDIRALYLQINDESVFDVIGTHSQLYK